MDYTKSEHIKVLTYWKWSPRKRKENGAKEIFEEIMSSKIPKLLKGNMLHIYPVARRSSSGMNSNSQIFSPLIKLLQTKDRNKYLQPAKEETLHREEQRITA